VISIISLADLVDYLSDQIEMAEHLANIMQYRLDFGI
jgi:orotate phosphoribosyltransferase